MDEREIGVQWLHEVLSYETGEEIYLPCESKKDMKQQYKRFIHLQRELEQVDPMEGTKVHIGAVFKDMKHWIVLRKISASPLVAFKKDNLGQVTKVVLDSISSRERRLKAMQEDGMTLEDVKELEDSLTAEEKDIWR